MKTIRRPPGSAEAEGNRWQCTTCDAVVEFELSGDYVRAGWDEQGRYVTADCPFCQQDYVLGRSHQEFRPLKPEPQE